MTIPGRSASAPDEWPVAVSEALLRALTAHPEQMADLIEALKRRVVDEDSLVELMTRAAREAVRLIQDIHWAGVTAQFAGVPVTAAHTEARVLVVDEGQYGQGDGPCLAAIRLDRTVAMTIEQVRDRWPDLARIADTAGVRAFRAEPLHVRDRAVGSLNLYSGRAGGLRTPDPDIVTVLTGYLDRGLTDYSAAQPGEAQAVQLRQHLLLRIYRAMVLTRAVEDRMVAIYKGGDLLGSLYTGHWHEAISVGAASTLRPDDYMAPLHRNLGAHLYRGMEAWQVMASFMGKASGPTGGRDGTLHYGRLDLGHYNPPSHIPANFPVATGMAFAAKYRDRTRSASPSAATHRPRGPTSTRR
jgi:hypothetical protein